MLKEVRIRLDWSEASAVPARPVNALLVQGFGDELTLVLGHAPPPIATANMSVEETIQYLDEQSVAVQQVARFTLPVDTARTLARRLQEALQSYVPAGGEKTEAAS